MQRRHSARLFALALAFGGATAAEAGDLSGSISLGKSQSRSETTVIVSPDGGTVTSTTRSETRGGGFDISFGPDRRYGPRHPWGGRPAPYPPPYYGPVRVEAYPLYHGPLPGSRPAPPPPYSGYGVGSDSNVRVRIGLPTHRTEERRETILVRPPGPFLGPIRP